MILLTGCNTLLGRTLLKKLVEKGEKVRCYDFYKTKDFPENLEFINGDLLDPRQLKKACDGVETIIHLMDIKRPGKKGRKYMKKVNIKGSENLLFAAQKASIKKFYFLSSYAVYGKPKAMPVRQDDRKKPVTAYGKDKLKIENQCWTLITKKSMPITIFRPALIIGPQVKDPVVLMSLFMALGMDEANRMYVAHNGNTKFQLLHPDDAADAIMAAYASKSTVGKAYNIGSDNVPTQMDQIVRLRDRLRIDPPLSFITPGKAVFLFLFLKLVKTNYFTREHLFYLLNSLILDCQNIKTDLGWQPKKDNMEILTETVEWYLKEKL